ncbi:R-spondin-2 [Tachysurus ichikawai]
MTCQPKLFLFLRRERMRQYGECLHVCPSGYYGTRGPEINMCSRCRIDNCETCFSKEHCTKCKPGFYLHKTRCYEKCPEGFAPLDDSMECGEGCEVGQWSEWGTCTRRNKTCGFKWGLETRTRHIVKKPPRDTIPCPTIAESRRCKMPMRHCRKGFHSSHQAWKFSVAWLLRVGAWESVAVPTLPYRHFSLLWQCVAGLPGVGYCVAHKHCLLIGA